MTNYYTPILLQVVPTEEERECGEVFFWVKMFGVTYPMKIQMFLSVLCVIVFYVDFCYTMVDG